MGFGATLNITAISTAGRSVDMNATGLLRGSQAWLTANPV